MSARSHSFDRDPSVLVVEYKSLVAKIASQLLKLAPHSFEFDDLFQIGTLGLLAAAKTWDADKGCSFKTHAGYRIRGNILDEMRKAATTSRQIRCTARRINEQENILGQQMGRAPTSAEVAEAMGMGLGEWHRIRQHVDHRQVKSMDADESAARQVALSVDSRATPFDEIHSTDVCHRLAKALNRLPERKRRIVLLWGDTGIKQKEIAAMMGVSPQHICTELRDGLAEIRDYMRLAG